jgi:hypothetical protein
MEDDLVSGVDRMPGFLFLNPMSYALLKVVELRKKGLDNKLRGV